MNKRIDVKKAVARMRSKALVLLLSLSMAGLAGIGKAYAVPVDAHPAIQSIVTDLVAQGLYADDELEQIFAGAKIQETILNAMKNPAESKFTWGRYRKIFMQEERINDGVDFWREYDGTLTRAQEEYGVPAEIIVAIIAVESKFGRFKGSHKVLDSLVSLVVDFPRRSAFFADELKHFLILCKENGLDPNVVLGSYAGAMGYPQFISSSYRRFAVDFSGDGKIDLIDQADDAIGSIANYFVENGWRENAAISSRAFIDVPAQVAKLASTKRSVAHSAAELRALGAPLDSAIAAEEKLGVLMLDASEAINKPSESGIYIVQAGDTACQIAEAHTIPCRELMRLNELGPQGKIYRGQRLKLPVKTKEPNTSQNDATPGWTISKNAEPESNPVQERYFFTHHNFYVITRYNQSVLYAMAVHELSQAIKAKRLSSLSHE